MTKELKKRPAARKHPWRKRRCDACKFYDSLGMKSGSSGLGCCIAPWSDHFHHMITFRHPACSSFEPR